MAQPNDYWHSQEYRRLQRERDAKKHGHVLCGYVPQADRAQVAAGGPVDYIDVMMTAEAAE